MEKENEIIGIGNFFTMNYLSAFNLATAAVTHSNVAHMGVMFKKADGTVVYFEARFEEGFVGPFPFERVYNWKSKSIFRSFHIRWLPLPEDDKEKRLVKKWTHAIWMVENTKGYAKNQLLAIWMHEWKGWHVPTDPSRVTCSEAGALIDAPEYILLDKKHKNCDSVTPGSGKKKLDLILQKRGLK